MKIVQSFHFTSGMPHNRLKHKKLGLLRREPLVLVRPVIIQRYRHSPLEVVVQFNIFGVYVAWWNIQRYPVSERMAIVDDVLEPLFESIKVLLKRRRKGAAYLSVMLT